MVRQKNAKSATLLTAAVVLLMSLTYIPDWSMVGVADSAALTARLVYPFFHASFLHAAVNVWCLLSIVFIHDVSLWRLLAAYVAAVLVPGFLLSDVPTVGLSCVCYFLLGSLLFEVERKMWFLFCMAIYIAVGFLLPSVNALVHLYGYLAGLMVGMLNAPLSCFRR